MSNLLPKKEQSTLNTEYSLRRISVIFFIVCVISLVSLALLFPSYILSHVRATAISADLENVKKAVNTASPSADFTASLNDAKDKAVALQVSDKNSSVYDLFHLFEDKSAAIKLKEISYNQAADETDITVQGIASDRESLVAFEDELKGYPNFSNVDLPISDLAKDTNIDFSMNLVVKK